MEAITTVNDLRKILAEEISKVRSGDTTAANVNAIVNASGKILTTIKMEIDYAKLSGKPLAINQLYRDWETDRKSTRLNSSHRSLSRMPSSA